MQNDNKECFPLKIIHNILRSCVLSYQASSHRFLFIAEHEQGVLYPSLRVEMPEIKIERVGGFPLRLIHPVGVESLDLEIDGHLSPFATAKGDGLAKLTLQLPIGSRLRARQCGSIPV